MAKLRRFSSPAASLAAPPALSERGYKRGARRDEALAARGDRAFYATRTSRAPP